MATELYNDGSHICLMYSDLVSDHDSVAVQSNQFLVIDHGCGALIDPGGNMTYHALYMSMVKYFPAKHLKTILASHADPDIIASLNKWLVGTDAQLFISKIWERFVPHFCSIGNTEDRIIGIPDAGMPIRVGKTHLLAMPAHFLHSEGNFQFYDPVSRILFSGDLGASLVPGDLACSPVTDFDAHVPHMEGFHRRYMVANKVCRLWADMVRELEIDMIVPQHGRYFKGARMVNKFIDWIERLQCGVDLMTQNHYRVPQLAAQTAPANAA